MQQPYTHIRLFFLHEGKIMKLIWQYEVENGSDVAGEFCERISNGDPYRTGLGPSGRCEDVIRAAKYVDAITALDVSIEQRSARAMTRASPTATTCQSMDYPLAGFWHVATTGPVWKSIVLDQFYSIINSGLDVVVEHIDIVVVGDADQLGITHPKMAVVSAGNDLQRYEFPTLERLGSYCHRNPTGRVFYIHNKGSTTHPTGGSNVYTTNGDTFLPVMDWRHMMEYFIITRYEDCLAALEDQGYDTCGVNLLHYPKTHYSGNFCK